MQKLKLQGCASKMLIVTNRKRQTREHEIQVVFHKNFASIDLTDKQLIQLRDFLNVAINKLEK